MQQDFSLVVYEHDLLLEAVEEIPGRVFVRHLDTARFGEHILDDLPCNSPQNKSRMRETPYFFVIFDMAKNPGVELRLNGLSPEFGNHSSIQPLNSVGPDRLFLQLQNVHR